MDEFLQRIADLQSADANVRKQAGYWIYKSYSKDTARLPYLIPMMDHDDPMVRDYTASALGWIGSSEAVPALVRALKDSHTGVRTSAVEALRYIADPISVPALLELITAEDDELRMEVCTTLGCIEDARAVPALIKIVQNETVVDVLLEAIAALGDCGGDEVLPHLLPKIDSPDFRIRAMVAYALGETHSPKAIPHLITLLQDEEARVRIDSAWGLIKNGDTTAIPHLEKLLVDEGTATYRSGAVYTYAASALKKMSTTETVNILNRWRQEHPQLYADWQKWEASR